MLVALYAGHPVVGLCNAFRHVMGVWLLEEDAGVTPDDYEVCRRFVDLSLQARLCHLRLQIVELPRREGAPLRVRPVTALRHPCFRRDGPPPARFCVTFDYVGPFFFTLPYPSGVHYPLTRDLRTKVFSCIPCEAHGQTVKKNWYRSRQRAPWLDSEGRVRRGYTQVLEFDNLYMNLGHATARFEELKLNENWIYP